MRINRFVLPGLVFASILFSLVYETPALTASNETEVRATVERVFQELKSKNYDALFENLPASSRTRLSRERFTSSLRRTQDTYALDRLEIGSLRSICSD